MRQVRLRVTFPKYEGRDRVATFEWSDGTVATTPIWTARGLPHDLGHYVGESFFKPPYGFWALAGRQAPFRSLTLVRGRWPKGRQEWLDRVMRKHGAEMLKAEISHFGVLDDGFDLDEQWPLIKRSIKKAYALTDVNHFEHVTKEQIGALRQHALRIASLWDSVPMGGALVVHWPPTREPDVILPADHTAATR